MVLRDDGGPYSRQQRYNYLAGEYEERLTRFVICQEVPGETLEHLDNTPWYHYDTYLELVEEMQERRRVANGETGDTGAARDVSDPVERLEDSPFAGVWDANVFYLNQDAG